MSKLKEIAPAISEIRVAKVSIFFLRVFAHLHYKNCYKTQTRTPIALKCGTQKESPTENPIIKFGANPMNDSGVMTDYSRKTEKYRGIGKTGREREREISW